MIGRDFYRVHSEDCAHYENEAWCTCGKHVKIQYCCKHPNPYVWIDQNFGMRTACVHCSSCSTIIAEIGILEEEE